MKVSTIGFTKKSAEEFFGLVANANVKRVIDVRLNNVSQLSGFTKRDDLAYFLRTICGVEYVYEPALAPTKDILDKYRKGDGSWSEYERAFLELMEERRVQDIVSRDLIDEGCLLCSEHQPHRCHRRLVADYLSGHWGSVQVMHLT